jgi:hypothetical protein
MKKPPLWTECIPSASIPEVLTDVLNDPSYAAFVGDNPRLTAVAIEAFGAGLNPQEMLDGPDPMLDAVDIALLRDLCGEAIIARFADAS